MPGHLPDEPGRDGQVSVWRDGKAVWEWPTEEGRLRAELADAHARIAELEGEGVALLDAINAAELEVDVTVLPDLVRAGRAFRAVLNNR